MHLIQRRKNNADYRNWWIYETPLWDTCFDENSEWSLHEKKMQLLVPVYFPGANVKLAFVLNKLSSGSDFYYEAVTVLPVEWAYMNARLIVKPDEEWAKILEESDSEIDDEF